MTIVYELIEIAKLKAILSKLQPDEAFTWRSIEREYSKTFHTPLHEVRKLDPEEVMLALCEDGLERFNTDEESELQAVLDNLYSIEDPEYDRKRDEEEIAYNEQAVREEEEKLRKKELKKKAKETPAKELPKSGGINLSYLSENSDNES